MSKYLTKLYQEVAKLRTHIAKLEADLSDRQAEIVAWEARAAKFVDQGERIAELETKNAELEARLLSFECGYCGEIFATPEEGQAHIRECEKHPLFTANKYIAELEAEIERLKAEGLLMLDFIKWLYIGRLREIDEHYQKLPDNLKTAIQETMTLENSHDPL